MFAHATPDGPLTHSLHVSQDLIEVIPSSTQTLDQKSEITYKLGIGFDTVTPKSPEKKAVDEQANTKALLDHFTTTLSQNPGATLQIRTLFQSQVTAYETVALAAPGDPLHPERQVTSPPHREETAGTVTLYQDGAVKVPVSFY
jgi:hypothetical protein